MIDAKRFQERYTEAFVRELAERDNPTLRRMPRMETWVGNQLFIRMPERQHVLLDREKDYERVKFTAKEDEATVWKRCDDAIREMGKRIEACLHGRPVARGFHGVLEVGRGVRPLVSWEAPNGCTLYSLGAVPRLLDADGLMFLRVRSEDGPVVLTGEAVACDPSLLKEAEQKYGDALYAGRDDCFHVDLNVIPTYEVRFAYYGNTGPTSVITERV